MTEALAGDFTTDGMLIKATERFICGKPFGGWMAALCACPARIETNPAVLAGVFGTVAPPSQAEVLLAMYRAMGGKTP